MRMRLALGVAVVIGLLTAGCTQQTAGSGTPAAVGTPSGATRTLGEPSAGPRPSTTSTSQSTAPGTASGTTTVRPTPIPTGSVGPGPTDPSPAVSSDTVTEYTTIVTTEQPLPPPSSDQPGPPDMGPNDSGMVQFQTPSGNINCGIYDSGDGGEARCDLLEWTFQPPASDRPCDFGDFYGGTGSVGLDGAGEVGACIGDTVADPANPVLAYGLAAGVGRFRCESAESGVTCTNISNGHGFRLSRGAYDVF